LNKLGIYQKTTVDYQFISLNVDLEFILKDNKLVKYYQPTSGKTGDVTWIK